MKYFGKDYANQNICWPGTSYVARDDKEAIDEDNIVEGRTRGAKPSGEYREPGDEEGLPSDDGTSAAAQ